MSKKAWSVVNHLVGWLIYIVFLGYFGTSIASLVVNHAELEWYGILLNILVLIFEMIGPTYVIYFMVQLFDGIMEAKTVSYDLELQKIFPKVAIMIPVRNAHPKILEETLEGFQKITYPEYEIWVGDDCSDKKYADQYEKICDNFKVNYYFGEERSFKSGILNKLYAQTDSEYIAFFDVDQIPVPDIIDKFVAVLEQNEQYAFVQARLEFRNVENLLHSWEMISYYQLACAQSGKMNPGNVIWHGCNACFRREYAFPIPEGKLSEDFDHTINLLAEGITGCWLKDVGVYTLPTDTFDHKVSQMFRWTTGQVGAVVDHTKKFFKSRMTLKQRVDLFISSTLTLVLSSLYLVGITYGLIYALNVPVYRALGLDALAVIIVPILIGLVYCVMITATSIYSIKNSEHKLGFFDVIFFLIFSTIAAPLLLIPTVRGLFRQNKLIDGKTQWNRRIKLYLIGTLYTILGIIFAGLTVISLLDIFAVVNWYNGDASFWVIFGTIAFMLLFSLPFIAIAKKRYKESPLFQDENVYI